MSSLKQTFKSVLSAFFGVQSNKNRQLDFSQGKLSHFIFAGVFAVAAFIATLVVVVYLVVPGA